jgi:enoyl-CoA hydratase/carnithine racemase
LKRLLNNSEDGMPYEHLLVTADGITTTITLNSPQKRNALALPVIHELRHAFEAVGNSDARGVILAANGPVFSAGHGGRLPAGRQL